MCNCFALIITSLFLQLEAFQKFFDNKIIKIILQYTNTKGIKKKKKKWKRVDNDEINAVSGILLAMGVLSVQDSKLSNLWAEGPFQIPFFLRAMSRNHFQDILAYIRFDSSATREKRKKEDKLAPNRAIHNIFTTNCKKTTYHTSMSPWTKC